MTHASRTLSLARIISQGLVAETAAENPIAAVENMLALQAQLPSSIPWAINLRVKTPSIGAINEAFESAELVRSWPMRGTIHVTSAKDHHWLRQVLRHRYRAWMRSFEEEGLTCARIEEAAQIAYSSIASAGPQSREELCAAWEQEGIRTGTRPQREAALRAGEKGTFLDRRHLFLALHIEGFLVGGPRRGNSFLFCDARTLPVAEGVAQGEADHEAALAELARRYAWGHGPVSVEDFSRWTSLTKRESRAALERAVRLRSDRPIVLGESGYQRADLDSLLSRCGDAARALFSCPSFDEVHVGYADRTSLATQEAERAICPAKNGMFRPIVIKDGRVIAVQDPRKGYAFLDSMRDEYDQSLLEEAEEIGEYLSGK
jgi:hypothetical protein